MGFLERDVAVAECPDISLGPDRAEIRYKMRVGAGIHPMKLAD